MYKLLTSFNKEHFERYDIKIPDIFDVKYIKSPYTQDELSSALKDCQFLFISSTQEVNKKVMEDNPQLKMIHTNGVGFDKIDIEYAKKKGILVVNNKAVNSVAVSELTINLILDALRKTSILYHEILINDYLSSNKKARLFNNYELENKIVGLIGLGDIGKQVAKRLKGFDCKIYYYQRNPINKKEELELNVEYLQLNELLKISDIISLHIPSNKETKHIINLDKIKLMKKDAILINTSRGDLINQDDLKYALENDLIAMACLDVISPEPAPKDLPLLNLKDDKKDKLIITPHIGGNTNEARRRALLWFIKDLEDYIDNKRLRNIVNP